MSRAWSFTPRVLFGNLAGSAFCVWVTRLGGRKAGMKLSRSGGRRDQSDSVLRFTVGFLVLRANGLI